MKRYTEKMEALIRHYQTDKVSGKPLRFDNCTLHHQLHNTKGNRLNYPLFIDSRCNGLPVAVESIGNDNKFSITDETAKRFERAFSAIKDLFDNESVELLLFFDDIGDLWRDAQG